MSVLWAAFPLGIMLGGFLNSYLITTFGWQMIFYVGGVLPLVIAALLLVMLPESLQFLIGRWGDPSQAKRILARMAPGAVQRDAVLSIARDSLPGVPVKHLSAKVVLFLRSLSGSRFSQRSGSSRRSCSSHRRCCSAQRVSRPRRRAGRFLMHFTGLVRWWAWRWPAS